MISGSSTDSTAATQPHRCRTQESTQSTAATTSAPDVPADQSSRQPSVPRGAGTVFCEKTYKVKIDDETVWQVPTRLKYVKKVGSGAYGCVASFVDTTVFVREETNSDDGNSSRQQSSCSGGHCEGNTKNGGQEGTSTTNKKLAVKKIGDLFRDLIDAKRIYREIKILKELKHDNIINLVEILDPQTPDFDDIYLVSDLMDTDLHRVIYSRQPLTPEHHQYFLYQLLLGLSFLHQADIIHRDLKPSNVLVNLNCDIKICDFGLARGLNMHPVSSQQHHLQHDVGCGGPESVVRTYSGSTRNPHPWEEEKIAIAAGSGSSAATRLVRLAQQQQGGGGYDTAEQRHEVDTRQDEDVDDMELTDYVVTRWYRPPEILISPFCYSKPVDLWSVGCIFAELLGRRALFAGKDHFDQLRRIVRIMGRPSTEEINKVANEGRGKHFNSSATGKKTSSTKKRRSEAARRFIESLPNNQPYNLEELFPEAPPAALDLLTRFLAFDPANRITVQEALRHEYFEGLHSVEDEPRVTSPVDWSFDNFVPTKRLLQNKVYQEILFFHPEIVLRDFPLLPSRGVHISPSTLPAYIRQPLSLLQQQRQASAPAPSSSKSLHSFSSTTVPSSCGSLRGSVSRSSQLSTGTPRSSSTLVPPVVHVHPPASSGTTTQLLSSSDEDRSLSAASTAPPDENQEALSTAVLLDNYSGTRAASTAGLSTAQSLAPASSCYYGACASKKGKVEGSSAGKHHRSGSGRESSNNSQHSSNLLHAEASSYSLPSTHPSSSVASSPPQSSCSVQSFPGLSTSIHTVSTSAALGASVNTNTMMKQRDSGSHFCPDTSGSLCCSSSPSYSLPTCASIASFASLPATLASSSSLGTFAPDSSCAAPRVLHSNRSTGPPRTDVLGSASAPATTEQLLMHTSSRGGRDGNGSQAQHSGDCLKQGSRHEISFDHSRRMQAQQQLVQNTTEGAGEGKRSSAVVYRARYHHAGHRGGYAQNIESSQLHHHPLCHGHGQRAASGSVGCSSSQGASTSTQSIGALLNGGSQGLHCPGGCTRSASLPSTTSELLAAAQQAVGSSVGFPPFAAPPQPGGSHRLASCAGHCLDDPLDDHRRLHVDHLLHEHAHSAGLCVSRGGSMSGGARCTSCCAEILTQPTSSKYSAFFNHQVTAHYDTSMCGGTAGAPGSEALQHDELTCSGHRGCKDRNASGTSCCRGPNSSGYSTLAHGGDGRGTASFLSTSSTCGAGERGVPVSERRGEGALSRDGIDYASRTTTRSSLCTDDGGFVADGQEVSSAALLQQFHNELQKQQLVHQEATMQGDGSGRTCGRGSGGRQDSSGHAVHAVCLNARSDEGSALAMVREGRAGRGETQEERDRMRELENEAYLDSSAARGAMDMSMDVSVGSDSEKKDRTRPGPDVMTDVDNFLLQTQQRRNTGEERETSSSLRLTEHQMRILRQQQLQGHLRHDPQQQI